jgi:DNA (cytosine-5)-methyltransferase 1
MWAAMSPLELIVDSFAGGGGASEGIRWALGRDPDIAINHDAEAVSMHRMNHPTSRHFTEDIWKVDPGKACGGRPVGLMWLSPDCKHFSRAKGGKPVSKRVRGLAWVAVRWAEAVSPRVICMENVEEFLTWGPLGEDGRPCRQRKGLTFRRFVGRLRALGYVVEWRSFRAADHGAPTTRRRLFLVARRDGQPIRWPAATHGEGLTPWRTAAECIDWSLPCPSIFDRSKPLAENTLRRIAAGIRRFVLETPRPFVVSLRGTGDSQIQYTAHDIDEPLRTISGGGIHAGLVVPSLIQTGYGERNGQAPRVLDLHAPLGTVVNGQKHALVAAYLARHFTGVAGRDLREPVPTVTAVDHHSLVTAQLGPIADRREQVRAFLVAYFGNEKDGGSLHDPMRTVTSRDRFGLVTVHGVDYAICDIGMRMLQPRELFRAQGFTDEYEIEHGIDDAGEIVSLTKTAQVRLVGNSVCPPLAKAIVRAQFDDSADVEQDLFTMAVA